MTSRPEFEEAYPALRGSAWEITSDASDHYNCIAWAPGDSSRWWWPDSGGRSHWPHGVMRYATLPSFVEAFGTMGYSPAANERSEPGVEKIAILTKNGRPTHAARQLPDGRWASKCGRSEDIVHDLYCLEGDVYGDVTQLLSRSLPGTV